jgi:catechol-2,3-dioxygenase
MVRADDLRDLQCPVRSELRHAGIYATDLERLTAFYGQMLGLVVTDRGVMSTGREIVFMTASPDQHHQLVLVGGRQPGTRSTVNQLAFRVDGLAQLQAYAQFLAGFDDIATRELSHGNAWSIYFEDPEGNGIEVYCDTPWYVSQPRAIPLDLGADGDRIWADTAALVEHDPSGLTVERWRADLERRFTAGSEASDETPA